LKTETAQGVILEYDSAAGKEPQGMAKILVPVFDSLLKKPIRTAFTSRGELQKVKLPSGMIETLNRMTGGQMASMLSDDSLKQFRMMAVFPEGPIKPGQSWTHEVPMKLPVLGDQAVKTSFRYEGTETRNGAVLDKIALVLNMKTVEKKPGTESKPAEKKEETGSLSVKDGKGILYFDNKAGRLIESSIEMKMKIDMKIMGQMITQDMDIQTHMTPLPAGTAAKQPANEK
jgi:hypothetical protein